MIIESVVEYLRDEITLVNRRVYRMRSKNCNEHPHINVHFSSVKQTCVNNSCDTIDRTGIITLDVWGKTKTQADRVAMMAAIEQIDQLWGCGSGYIGNNYVFATSATADWQPIDIDGCDDLVYQRQYKIIYN